MMPFALFGVAVLAAAQSPQTTEQARERGRELTRQLLAGDAAALAPQMSPAFLEAVGGREGVTQFAGQISQQAGGEVEVLREAVYREAGHLTYYRVSRFERLPDVTTRWVIGPDGLVAGASVKPTPTPAPSPHEQYRTRAELRLPFGGPANGGQWYVAWGGRTAIENYHVVAQDQRYAYDFVVSRDGAVASGEGKRNEDHFCWNEPVLAPAAGQIVRAVANVADNERPGSQRDDVSPPGNHVVIDHGRGEYSLIAHFQYGSVAVREGQQVTAGALLGRCGNSGRSSMPHIHYHLQNAAAYGDGEGLPAIFNDYEEGGTPVAQGEPVRGQYILPAEGRAAPPVKVSPSAPG